jgi:hypothetical protein
MSLFTEIAIPDYRLLLADQGKQTSVFCLQQIKRNLPFPFSVRRKPMEIVAFP